MHLMLALPATASATTQRQRPDGCLEWTLSENTRLAKAALLLCDRIHIGDGGYFGAVYRLFNGPADAADIWLREYGSWEQDAEAAFTTEIPPFFSPDFDLALAEIERGVRAGVFHLDWRDEDHLWLVDDDGLQRLRELAEIRPDLAVSIREGFLAALVLAELPVFPDAEIDVLLDVRERIGPQRVRLAGAIAGTAFELRDVDRDDFPAAAREVLRKEINPAIADVDASLEELGAVPTLLRLASSKEVAAAAGASALTLAAGRYGPVDVGALVRTLAAAPVLAAVAKEAVVRGRYVSRAAENRYALLHAKLVRRLTKL
jgi:hypothetical protein